jgi:acetyl-CoA acyltransferase 1
MSSARSQILVKSPNDVVIVSALRTPITKGKKGGFKDTHPEYLLSHVLRAVYTRVRLDPALVEDVAVGNVLPLSGGATAARMAALHAGIPNTTAVNTVNRQCASGLAAMVQIANEIEAGQIDIGIGECFLALLLLQTQGSVGAGAESMTLHNGLRPPHSSFSPTILANQEAKDCLIPMGITSENVATDFNISREEQDAFAVLSFQKASAARRAGKFVDEIVPVPTKVKVTAQKDAKTTEVWQEVVVKEDDGIRDDVTASTLAKLKPAFIKTGSTHAGNASQVSDGAAAVLLARRSVAERLGLPILGKFVTAVTVGVEPRIMGVGPAYAIPKVGLTLSP